MKKKELSPIVLVSLIVCIASEAIGYVTAVHSVIPKLVLVIAFPVFVLSLCLWSTASDREGDTPFVGY